MIAKIKDIFADVSKEMKKVSWPTRQQLKESTLVVIGTCASVTFFVWIVDLVMAFVIKRLIF
ncbi:MAG: preprotein translocase subunit SecE [Ignavibacteriae bacterium]|nr:preprotein translocase subunit SecE [Ignavibacteriota bacterium]